MKLPHAFPLLLLLASAPLSTKADDTNLTTAQPPLGNLAPAPPPAPPVPSAPETPEHAAFIKSRLAAMAKRMLVVQQQTPDPNIKAIIDRFHLDDTAGLAAQTPPQSMDTIKGTAIRLYQASRTDPLAVQLMKEFQITYTPNPAQAHPSPPPSIPSTSTTTVTQ